MTPEPIITVEHEDGTGGDLPGWYVRRTLRTPVRSPPSGNVSIAGPFTVKGAAERWLRFREREPGALLRMLPIPPAALIAKQPDPDQERGEAQVNAMRQAGALYKATQRARGRKSKGREPAKV